MNPRIPPPPPAIQWIKAAEGQRRLGYPPESRGLFESELLRQGIRTCRAGKRGLLMVAAEDVRRAAQRMAQGGAL